MSNAKKIYDQAMELSASERASLAHNLILSLDAPSNLQLHPTYEAEIQRRVQMVREGSATGRPAGDIISELKAKYE